MVGTLSPTLFQIRRTNRVANPGSLAASNERGREEASDDPTDQRIFRDVIHPLVPGLHPLAGKVH